jgi:two-component system cell cycle sensor histidine kinase/response regulator CckA
MPSGGSLTLATRNYQVDHGYVELSVSDTGVGIPKEIQEKLFEPFFTTKELGKGTGLGLSTVYGIVQQSGGYIRVESEPGHGATFRVYLPRCLEEVPSVETPAAKLPHAVQSLVLVVEDEEALREAIAAQLRGHDYKVLAAADGVEALELLADNPGVAVLITDLIMPRMGGRELLRIASQRAPKLRIMVMSGYADQAFHEEECNGCPTAFLQKPFSLGTLMSRLAELYTRPHTEPAPRS